MNCKVRLRRIVLESTNATILNTSVSCGLGKQHYSSSVLICQIENRKIISLIGCALKKGIVHQFAPSLTCDVAKNNFCSSFSNFQVSLNSSQFMLNQLLSDKTIHFSNVEITNISKKPMTKRVSR